MCGDIVSQGASVSGFQGLDDSVAIYMTCGGRTVGLFQGTRSAVKTTMKALLAAAVLLVLTTRSVLPSPVVECEGNYVDKYVQDDADCGIYWLCGDGWASEYQCSNGLHFNLRTGLCDTPMNAGCSTDRNDFDTNVPATRTPMITERPYTYPVTPSSRVTERPYTYPVAPTSVVTHYPQNMEPSYLDPRMICRGARANRWHLPHPRDRTKFYKCDLNTGEGTVFSCPSGQVFNPSFQVCDWPYYDY